MDSSETHTAALSRIYELKDDCDYIMMKSTITKEFNHSVSQQCAVDAIDCVRSFITHTYCKKRYGG